MCLFYKDFSIKTFEHFLRKKLQIFSIVVCKNVSAKIKRTKLLKLCPSESHDEIKLFEEKIERSGY